MHAFRNIRNLFAGVSWLLLVVVLLTATVPTKVFAETLCQKNGLSDLDCRALYGGWENWVPDNGNTACSSGSTALTGSDNPQKAYNYFLAKGLTNVQSAAIVGNFMQESHVNPETGNGYIAQWTGGRLAALEAFAASADRPVTDLGLQLDFVWHELSGPYSGVLDTLKKQLDISDATGYFMGTSAADLGNPDIDDATIIFINQHGRVGGYENPGLPRLDNRVKYAQQILDLYGAAGSASGTATNNGCVSGSLGKGTGKFTTNSAIKYSGVDKALARAQDIALKPGGNGSLFQKVCDGTAAIIGGPNCAHGCAHVTAEVWGYSSSGSTYAVGTSAGNGLWYSLLASGHAHPGDRNVPIGAIVFYSTGAVAGHVATYVGDNLIASNDVGDGESGVEGGFYITAASDLESGPWHLSYLGWADPLFQGNTNVHFGSGG